MARRFELDFPLMNRAEGVRINEPHPLYFHPRVVVDMGKGLGPAGKGVRRIGRDQEGSTIMRIMWVRRDKYRLSSTRKFAVDNKISKQLIYYVWLIQ